MKRIAFLAALGAALSLTLPATATASWTWPVRGDVVSKYRNGDDPYAGGQHRGIDIAAPVGTRVVAASGGRVTYVGVPGDSGLTVTVRTDDGSYDTSYLHLASASVREGQAVGGGDALGAVGTSGRRSVAQPHLHFGVRHAGSRHAYRDPMDFLPPVAPPSPAPRSPVVVPAARPSTVPPAAAPAPAAVGGPAPAPAPSGHGARAGSPALAPGAALGALGLTAGSAATRVAPGSPAAAPTTAGTSRRAASRPSASASSSSSPQAHGERRETARNPDLGRAPDGALAPHARSTHHAAAAPRADRRRVPGSDRPGIDVGWLAALLGMIVAALALSQPDRSRRTARGGRLVLAAVLRPLTNGGGRR
jgi:hypothetical protein